MKKIVVIFFIISLIFTAAAAAEIIDKVIAVVNNEVVAQSELDRILIPIYAQYKEIYGEEELAGKMEAARRELLLQIIEDKLIVQEAQRRGIVVDEAEIEARIMEVKTKFTSEEEFKKVLAGQNLSVDILSKRYKEQLMMKKIFDKEVKTKVVILPTQIQEYYKEHLNEFEEPETVVLRMITLKFSSPEEKQKISEKVTDIKKRLDEGEAFDELAKKFSEDSSAIEGGLLGYVKKGQFMERIDEEIFKLNEGEISRVIESEVGFHIFKVDEKIPARTCAFSEVREKIENMFYQQKINQKFEEWMDKLKKDAYISIK